MVGAQQLGGLVEDDLDVARVLAVLGGERAGALAGLDVGQRAHAALGLRDDLVRDDEHVAGAERRVERRGREQRGEVVAGADLRQARQRCERESPRQAACAEAIPSSSARVRGAPPARAASAARSAARSPGVSTSSSSEGRRPIRTRAPAAWASAAWRANDPGPNAGSSAVGRCDQQRVRARAVAVGDDHDARRRGSASSSVTSAGSSAGQSPGHEQHPLRAPLHRRAGRRGSAAADWPASSGSCTDLGDARPRSELRGHDDHAVEPLHAPQRLEHVARHRARQRAALVGPHGLAEALLGEAEGLDGEDGQRAHGRGEGYPRRAAAKFSASRATRRRASASPISTSVSSVGTSLARSSLTRPSISPA